MRMSVCVAAVLAAFAMAPVSASAQTLAGENAQYAGLSECVVLKTIGEDRLTVARWMIAAFATAPQVKDVVTIAAGKKEVMDQAMARLFTRLLTIDCADHSRPLFQAKNLIGFEIVGAKLGEIAVAELLTNKEAAGALELYADYLNKDDFNTVAGRSAATEP